MSPTVSPESMALSHNLLPQMPPQLARRSSRSSGSQAGSRSSRIEKPRSNHNSPRVLERRKTTSGTKRYATLDDHYNMMFGLTGSDDEGGDGHRETPRPVSWHPSSAHFHVPSRPAVPEPVSQQDGMRHQSISSRDSAHGSDFYSLSTRNSTYTDQLQNFPALSPSHQPTRHSQSSESSWQEVSQQHQGTYALSSYSTPATEPMPWYLQEWARKNQAQANGSSDFLPIQRPSVEQGTDEMMEDDDDDDDDDAGKELVGMGLYDLPETTQSWNALEGTGKGLKLEETWQPPEEDDDEDVDDASSDDGSVEELPRKESEPLPLHSKPQLPPNMEGQSFFFDEDETYTKEWWYQQLKQPTVRDTGLGYDWL